MHRLLDAGARVNARQSGGHTPLHEAALGGDAEVVRLLLAAGADPETGNHEGQTPADVARQAGRAAIADAIDAGARGGMGGDEARWAGRGARSSACARRATA